MTTVKAFNLFNKKDTLLSPKLSKEILSDYEENRYPSEPSVNQLLCTTRFSSALLGVLPRNFHEAAALSLIKQSKFPSSSMTMCVLNSVAETCEKTHQIHIQKDDLRMMVIAHATDKALRSNVSGKEDCSAIELLNLYHDNLCKMPTKKPPYSIYTDDYCSFFANQTMDELALLASNSAVGLWKSDVKTNMSVMSVNHSDELNKLFHMTLNYNVDLKYDDISKRFTPARMNQFQQDMTHYADKNDMNLYLPLALWNAHAMLNDTFGKGLQARYVSNQALVQTVDNSFHAAACGDKFHANALTNYQERPLKKVAFTPEPEPKKKEPIKLSDKSRFVIHDYYRHPVRRGYFVRMSYANDLPQEDGTYLSKVACNYGTWKDKNGNLKSTYYRYYSAVDMIAIKKVANTDGDKMVFRADTKPCGSGVSIDIDTLERDDVPFDMKKHTYHTRMAKLDVQGSSVQNREKYADVQMGE